MSVFQPAALGDGPRGMPPSNLSALREFLALHRPTPEQSFHNRHEPKLPESTRKELKNFFDMLRETRFLEPANRPYGGWRTFYADSWEGARLKAKAAAEAETKHSDKFGRVWKAAWDCARFSKREAIQKAAAGLAGKIVHDRIAPALAKEGLPETWAKHAVVDAGLLADLLVVKDRLPTGTIAPGPDSVEYAWEAWKVWDMGYALFEDVNGRFYVYCKGSPPDEQKTI